jgi:hypothetical protein
MWIIDGDESLWISLGDKSIVIFSNKSVLELLLSSIQKCTDI